MNNHKAASDSAIWVDADACPIVIKEILFKAAMRTHISLTLVANHFMRIPKAHNIQLLQVERGFDVADNTILARVNSGDFVVTSDIPLADELVEKGAVVITPRGELLTTENIKPKLNIRDFMETLRASGQNTSGPPPLSNSDKQSFANALDKWLAKNV